MSARSDLYLSLCLEQANKSPLHYRHGCVVVRGGKVIGAGFNDFRSGFDGGALKTGQFGNRKKRQQKPGKTDLALNSGDFVAFETSGGEAHVNTSLSMHSEMMAIQAALAASPAAAATSSCRALSGVKPCFKLSGTSKHTKRLRKDALKQYVEHVFRGAEETKSRAAKSRATEPRETGSHVQEWRFESGASKPSQGVRQRLQQQGRERTFLQGGESWERPSREGEESERSEEEECGCFSTTERPECNTTTRGSSTSSSSPPPSRVSVPHPRV